MGWTSKAPAADPLIGYAALKEAQLAENTANFFNEKFAPRYLDQMDFQLALAKEQSERDQELQDFQLGLTRKYDDRYWNTQVPLEDTLIRKAREFNEPAEQERMASQASADVSQAFGNATSSMWRGLARRGGANNPGAAFAYKDMMTEEALAKAGAMNQTREAARQMGWTRLGEAAALGRGLPGFGATSAGLSMNAGQGAIAAGQSGMQAIQAAQGGWNSNAATVGNLWSGAGSLAATKTSLDQKAAETNNAMMNTLVGAAAGVGTSWGLSKIPS